MPAIPHVIRRGAAYHWRRRLPTDFGNPAESPMLRFCLQTKEPARARFLAGQVTAFADTLIAEARSMGLTTDQLKGIFAPALKEHLDRLDRIIVRERAEPDFDPEEERLADTCMGWVYRLLETRGNKAGVDTRAISQMETAGLDNRAIARVAYTLAVMQAQGLVPERKEKLESIVKAQGGEPSPMNCMLAEAQIYRARSAACFQLGRRHDGIRMEEEALVTQVLHDTVDRNSPSYDARVLDVMDEPFASDDQELPIDSVLPEHAPVSPAAPQEPPPPSVSIVPANHFVPQLGNKLIAERSAGSIDQRSWDAKTCKQARQTFTLFAKSLCEVGVARVEQLEQKHFAGMIDIFSGLAKSYGKSLQDDERTVSELLAIGAAKDFGERGLAPETINRHLTFLQQWVDFARARGIKIDRDLDVPRLRRKIRGRARDKRGFFEEGDLQAIFKLACFTGCQGWQSKLCYKPGDLIFHRALYYVPMLLFYTLARREEVCGLEVEDVSTVICDGANVPVINIRHNGQRRIKNDQSERSIPLHPELVRLGFPDYVNAIRQLGSTALFPDLKSPSSQSPLGDRFYDEFFPGLREAIPAAAARKQVIHSLRRTGGDQLKRQGVSSERRGDILGHAGLSIAEEVYSNDTPLDQKLTVLMKLPNLTKALTPQSTNLLPWILRRELPPFSRPSRMRKKIVS